VRSNNKEWFEAHLSKVQKVAAAWEAQGRPEGLLLLEADLVEAKKWAAVNESSLTGIERKFLEASEAKQEAIRREQRQARRLRVALGVAIVLAVAALFATWRAHKSAADAYHQEVIAQGETIEALTQKTLAEKQGRIAYEKTKEALTQKTLAETEKGVAEAETIEATKQSQMAFSRQLAAQSAAQVLSSPQKSLLMALESISLSRQIGRYRPVEAGELLHELLAETGGIPLGMRQVPATASAVSPKGRWAATGGGDGTIQLQDITNRSAAPVVLTAHAGAANVIAFSADERWLAGGDSNEAIFLWDLTNPQATPLRLSCPRAGGPQIVPSFSSDGNRLAIASNDAGGGVIQLYDLSSAVPSKDPVIKKNLGYLTAVALSPDGNRMAFASGYETWLFERVTDKLAEVRPVSLGIGHEWVTAVAFSPNGRWLAYGVGFGGVRLLDTTDSKAPGLVLQGQTGSMLSIVFSHDSKWLATGNDDYTALLWDVTEITRPPVMFRGHEAAVNALAFSADGRQLATWSNGDGGRLWNIPNPAGDRVMLPSEGPSVVAFSPDGHWLASGANGDGAVRLWDLTRFPIVISRSFQFEPGKQTINSISFSPKTHWLAAASESSSAVYLWNVFDLSVSPQKIVLNGGSRINCLAFSPDGAWLATGSSDGAVLLWDLKAPDPSASPKTLTGGKAGIRAMAFSPDGRLLATGSSDSRHTSAEAVARIWDLTADSPSLHPVVLSGFRDIVFDVAFSPDGQLLAVICWDGTARIWNVTHLESPAQVGVLNFKNRVYTQAFSSDGRWYAAGSRDTTIAVLDFKRPNAAPVILRGHSSEVLDVRFSPGGQQLATASDGDNTTRLWDLENLSAAPVILRGSMRCSAACADFSPDGRWYATTGADNVTRLWYMRVDELIELACRTAGRNLNRTEWQQMMSGQPYHKTCPEFPPGVDSGTTKISAPLPNPAQFLGGFIPPRKTQRRDNSGPGKPK
jgi:WD40 repeat protein